jgi:hypothetical protein
MGADVKAELNIPDLWYDFYSRLLPGFLFVLGWRYFYFSITAIPTLDELILLFVIGYFCGLFSQPIASTIILLVFRLVEVFQKDKIEKYFIRTVQIKIGLETNASRILSKMHGEVAFFIQVFLLSIILFSSGLFLFKEKLSYYYLILPLLSFLLSLNVAYRRLKRAKEYNTVIK